jgi:hypothetical protein
MSELTLDLSMSELPSQIERFQNIPLLPRQPILVTRLVLSGQKPFNMTVCCWEGASDVPSKIGDCLLFPTKLDWFVLGVADDGRWQIQISCEIYGIRHIREQGLPRYTPDNPHPLNGDFKMLDLLRQADLWPHEIAVCGYFKWHHG